MFYSIQQAKRGGKKHLMKTQTSRSEVIRRGRCSGLSQHGIDRGNPCRSQIQAPNRAEVSAVICLIAQKVKLGEEEEGKLILIQQGTKFLNSRMGKRVSIREVRGSNREIIKA